MLGIDGIAALYYELTLVYAVAHVRLEALRTFVLIALQFTGARTPVLHVLLSRNHYVCRWRTPVNVECCAVLASHWLQYSRSTHRLW